MSNINNIEEIIQKLLDSNLLSNIDNSLVISEKLNSLINKNLPKEKNKSKSKKVKDISSLENFEDWIINWNSKFPKTNLLNRQIASSLSGKYGVREKMIKFIKEYPQYSLTIIDEATNNYLAKEKLKSYQFTKSSDNFISKQGEASKLAMECENILTNSNNINSKNNNNKDTDDYWFK